MNAGISISDGIMLLAENEGTSDVTQLLEPIREQIDCGTPIHEAFATSSHFPAYMINMMRIGEETGNLDTVFRALSTYYDRQQSIAHAIRRAVVFPCVLFVIMLVVIGVLVVQVLPIFNDVFSQLGSTMSPIALTFMNFGVLLNRGRYIILGLLLLVFVIFFALYTMSSFQDARTKLQLRFMKKTKLGNEIGTARFAAAMAMAMASGLDMDHSLEMAENISQGTLSSDKAKQCRELIIEEGSTFSDAATKVALFDPLYCHMLTIGVKTGAADSVMEEIAKRNEVKANESIERTIDRIEPIFVVIMSLLIGLVLLSVMLPLMGIMSSIG